MCECCDYVAARRSSGRGRVDERTLLREWELIDRGRTREAVRAGSWRIRAVMPGPTGATDAAHATDATGATGATDVAFSYTMGLWSHGHPELVIFGLDHREAGALLNAVGEHARRGALIEDGDSLEVGDWQLSAFRLPNPGKVVLGANQFYRRPARRSVPALQLVYPDAHGTWPWEPGCHLPLGSQPLPGTFAA